MTETLQVGKFHQVDESGQAARLLAFLDFCEQMPQMPELRERSHELLGERRPGRALLDAGCGTGTATADLAERGYEVVGVDVSALMVSAAEERHPGLPFQIASAEELPFEDASFDGYRAERLFQHLADPTSAMAEARRVLRPGGRIVLVDVDADLWTVDAADMEVTRAMARAFARTIAYPWIGRRYRALLLDAGFEDVVVELHPLIYTDFALVAPMLQGIATAGVAADAVTQEQADAWMADQQERSQENRTFLMVPMFVAAASVPV